MSVVSPEPPPTPCPALAERCRGTGGRAGGRGAVQGPAASARVWMGGRRPSRGRDFRLLGPRCKWQPPASSRGGRGQLIPSCGPLLALRAQRGTVKELYWPLMLEFPRGTGQSWILPEASETSKTYSPPCPNIQEAKCQPAGLPWVPRSPGEQVSCRELPLRQHLLPYNQVPPNSETRATTILSGWLILL